LQPWVLAATGAVAATWTLREWSEGQMDVNAGSVAPSAATSYRNLRVQ